MGNFSGLVFSSPVMATAYAEEKLDGKKKTVDDDKDSKCQVCSSALWSHTRMKWHVKIEIEIGTLNQPLFAL